MQNGQIPNQITPEWLYTQMLNDPNGKAFAEGLFRQEQLRAQATQFAQPGQNQNIWGNQTYPQQNPVQSQPQNPQQGGNNPLDILGMANTTINGFNSRFDIVNGNLKEVYERQDKQNAKLDEILNLLKGADNVSGNANKSRNNSNS